MIDVKVGAKDGGHLIISGNLIDLSSELCVITKRIYDVIRGNDKTAAGEFLKMVRAGLSFDSIFELQLDDSDTEDDEEPTEEPVKEEPKVNDQDQEDPGLAAAAALALLMKALLDKKDR